MKTFIQRSYTQKWYLYKCIPRYIIFLFLLFVFIYIGIFFFYSKDGGLCLRTNMATLVPRHYLVIPISLPHATLLLLSVFQLFSLCILIFMCPHSMLLLCLQCLFVILLSLFTDKRWLLSIRWYLLIRLSSSYRR